MILVSRAFHDNFAEEADAELSDLKIFVILANLSLFICLLSTTFNMSCISQFASSRLLSHEFSQISLMFRLSKCTFSLKVKLKMDEQCSLNSRDRRI